MTQKLTESVFLEMIIAEGLEIRYVIENKRNGGLILKTRYEQMNFNVNLEGLTRRSIMKQRLQEKLLKKLINELISQE